jgi:hypothetical protein
MALLRRLSFSSFKKKRRGIEKYEIRKEIRFFVVATE